MTSPIGPVLGPSGITPIGTDILTPAISGTSGAAGAAGAAGIGEDFASKLAEGLEYVQGLQDKTSALGVQAATGDLNDVHDYMIASAESGIATSLTVAVRNKAVEAFQEIMRMQA